MPDARVISYSDMLSWPMDDRNLYVYAMCDGPDCLYVGSTDWLRKRAHGHLARAKWPIWRASTVLVSANFADKETMLAAERKAIAELEPLFNRRFPRGFSEAEYARKREAERARRARVGAVV